MLKHATIFGGQNTRWYYCDNQVQNDEISNINDICLPRY